MIDVSVRLSLGSFTLNAELKDEGHICISGLNGSGKTTLLSIIGGIRRPDSGHVRLMGTDVTGLPIEKRGVVLVTPDSYIRHLDVDRHLVWGAEARKSVVGPDELSVVKSDLGVRNSSRVGSLSQGMRERVSLATALLSGTRTLLVDEAFSNIDNRNDFIPPFCALAKKRGTVLIFSTQDAAESRFADHHYQLVDGSSKRIQ